MRQEIIPVEKTVDLLRLCVINMKKNCDDISTDDEKNDLEEISRLCEKFLKRKGWLK